MCTLKNLNNLKQSLPPKLTLGVRTLVHPVRTYKRKAELRELYPASWRWVLLSENIQGFLSVAEANALYCLARDLTPRENAVAVELGSWKGKSSVMIAGGLLAKQAPRLFCVDPFGCDEDPEYQRKYYESLLHEGPRDVETVFRKNVRSCGVEAIVSPIRGYSFECCRNWTRPIDLLFIDANHEYRAVLRDFNNWVPFVKAGGVVAFHDVGEDFDGPKRVVAEELRYPSFEPVNQVDRLAWAVKCQSN